ncbi:F-box only protein 47-like [Ornithodoros turicata]|uniref:F-box only protein 47-like n=1 Tax=Ornithodoros turicata TaxID=34597 RepID=UPI0031399B3D
MTKLPPELLHHILSFCDAHELSILSLCSKWMRDEVLHFCQSLRRHLDPLPREDPSAQASALGILMKRVTCLYPTKERLNLMVNFITKYIPAPCLSSDLKQWHLFGRFLFAAIAGWDDDECSRVYEALISYTAAGGRINTCVYAAPGKYVKEEITLRNLVTTIVFNQTAGYERALWIYLFLKPHPIACKAQLLFILCGPSCQHGVLWDLPDDRRFSDPMVRAIDQLAESLLLLHAHAVNWTPDDTSSVLEELTRVPEEWSLLNVSRLMLACGKEIALLSLASKLRNGRYHEVGRIVANMFIVEDKGYAGRVTVYHLLDALQCEALYNNLPTVFGEMITDCVQEDDDDQQLCTDLLEIASAQNCFISYVSRRFRQLI